MLRASLLAALAFATSAGWAATFTVTNTNDSGTGSLRDAMSQAETNGGGSPVDDVIKFDPALDGATITLSSEIAIIGPTAGGLIVDAADLPGGITVDGGPGTNRIFFFSTSSPVELRNLKLRGGDGTGGNATFNGQGGAIIASQIPLTLKHCTLSGNTASGSGGAIYATGLRAESCTFSGNQVPATSTGGGGAIRFEAGSTSVLVNCTFTGNSAPKGGAILFKASAKKLELIHCTVAENLAGPEGAGGIEMEPLPVDSQTLRLVNTIVAGNTAGAGSGNKRDLLLGAGTTFLLDGQNIIQKLPDSFDVSAAITAHLINADPKLKPLGNYGGPTQTMALKLGSPAIDGGRAATFAAGENPPTRDQRGYPRVNGPWGDIGAFEADVFYGIAVSENRITVTTLDDELDPYGVDGTGISLREAIRDVVTGGVIYFSPAVFGAIPGNPASQRGAVELKSALGPLVLKRDVIIDARDGNTRLRVKLAAITGRLFEIPLKSPLTRVTLYTLSLQSGSTPMNDAVGGGGVLNYGDLVMTNCEIYGCSSAKHGGGIANYQFLTLDQCIFDQNNANTDAGDTQSAGGGAVWNTGGLFVQQCVFTNGTARTGGAIDHRTAPGQIPGRAAKESMIVNHCTFVQNAAKTEGGGIYAPVPWTLKYSVFDKNTRDNGGSPVVEHVRTIDTQAPNELAGVGKSYGNSSLVNLAGSPFTREFFVVGDPMLENNIIPKTGSPVIDQDGSPGFATDNFGNSIMGKADAGALESGSIVPAGFFQFSLTGAAPKDAATVTASVTAGGTWTGSVMVAGPDAPAAARAAARGLAAAAALPANGFKTLVIKFTGQIDPATKIATILLDAGGIALTLTLTLNDDGTITAKLTGGDGRSGESTPTFALPAKGQLNAGAVAGRYTLAAGDLASLQNVTYGTLTVDKKGTVKFIGTLTDGTKVSFATKLDSYYRFSARVALFKKLGFFSMTSKIDPEGIATAGFAFSILPENIATVLKPGAAGFFFANQSVSLHRYLPPGKKQQVTDSFAQSGGAGFCGRVVAVIGQPNPSYAFQLATSGATKTTVVGLKVKVFPATGLFSGTEPSRTVGAKPLPMNGAIFQTYDTTKGFGIGYGNSREAGAANAIYVFSKDLNGP